jgi:hypothetical protein
VIERRAFDLGVTIDRVRVRAGASAEPRPRPVFVTGYVGGHAGAPLHDHRIVIRELCIDIEAAVDASDARRVGKQVASELASRLALLQDQRRPRIITKPSSGGPICVETLHLHLRGEVARHPPGESISAALMNAFEARVRHG